jgi:hypothetical protein
VKGSDRGLILMHYPCFCLEWLRNTTNKLRLDSRSAVRESNPGSPEYDAGVLTTWPRLSVSSRLLLPLSVGTLFWNTLYKLLPLTSETKIHTKQDVGKIVLFLCNHMQGFRQNVW